MSSNTKKFSAASAPAVGIRPVIDGRRRGVRESLEERTMSLAKTVAHLISSSIRLPDGDPVRCVIADTTIGGVAEAAACAEKFRHENVGVSITVTQCWCYGSETMDMDPLTPKAVFGFNGTERPGAVYLAAVLAAHAQKGLPAFGIYGHDVLDADDTVLPDDVREKLLVFTQAALAAALMRGKSYVSIGGTSMGIAGSTLNHEFLERHLGMRVECLDMSEIRRRIDAKIYDSEEYTLARGWVASHCKEGSDKNTGASVRSRSHLDLEWDESVKMALIVRDIMDGNPALAKIGWFEEAQGRNAIAAGFQGQRQWTDGNPNGDFMEAILNSSFDWNGTRRPRVVATENDALNAVSMLFGHLLTNTAQVFADVRTYWSPTAVKRVTGHTLDGRAENGIIHLINSGAAALDGSGRQSLNGAPAMKPHWEISPEEVEKCLAATTWHPSVTEYFPGGGWSSKFITLGEMPVTLTRLNFVKGLGPVLQIAEGWTVSLPTDVHNALDLRTDWTWPTTWFAPRLFKTNAFKDVYSVMNHWGANHGSISYGHIGAQLLALAAILRIPVYMHNIDDSRIFRPAVWNSFGTACLESADFRACANFGPLYG
ncbi:MAG: L-fucose isomerase [Puniceicoccales bacterium]|jgi:L-fucose isomerase|nr:L-fucose isomerase [Puniceicoccales bacterium]